MRTSVRTYFSWTLPGLYAVRFIMVLCSQMTPDQLRGTLAALNLTQAEFARLINVTPRAVALWLSEGRPVPGPAAAYARLLNSLPLVMRQIELNRVKGTSANMRDGLYAIEYQGVSGARYGTMLLSKGKIYGADPAGGRYDGVYALDPVSGLVNAYVKLFFPKNLASVFGEAHTYDWVIDASATFDPHLDQGTTRLQVPPNRWVNVAYRFLREVPPAP